MVAGDILASCQALVDVASNTAVRMPSRPSMRFRRQIGGKLREIRPHHHAEIWRRRRPRRAQLGDPGLGGLGVVLPCQRAEAGGFDRLARRSGGQEKTRGRRPRPGDGIVRLAAIQHDVVGRKSCRPASARAGSRGRAAPGRRCSSPHAAATRRRNRRRQTEAPAHWRSGTTPARSARCAPVR